MIDGVVEFSDGFFDELMGQIGRYIYPDDPCMVLPWEPTTFIFRGYSPYIGGSKPSFFLVLGAHGMVYLPTFR